MEVRSTRIKSFGTFLGLEKLRIVAMSAGLIADKTDDELKARFGQMWMDDN